MTTPLPHPLDPAFAALAAKVLPTGTPAASARPTVAEQLVVYRLARRETQEELAAAAGVRRATVADAEAGRIDPKASTLTALAKALDVTIYILP